MTSLNSEMRNIFLEPTSGPRRDRALQAEVTASIHHHKVTVMRDGQRLTLYKPSETETVPDTVSINGRGDRVLFQSESRKKTRVMEVAVPPPGSSSVKKPHALLDLPQPATALDLSPDDGRLALAFDTRVEERNLASGGTSVLQMGERVVDVEYLHDGSLAIRTASGLNTERFFHAASATATPHEVTLKELDPEEHERELRDQVSDVEFLEGRPLEQVERFLGNDRWLASGDGYAEHIWQPCRDGNRVMALVPAKGMLRVFEYDLESGRHRPIGEVAGTDPKSYQMVCDSGGTTVVLWNRPTFTQSSVFADRVTIHVLDAQSGEARVVPDVAGLLYHPQKEAINFEAPDGARREVGLKQIDDLKAESWYRASVDEYVRRHQGGVMAGERPPATVPGEVNVQDDFVVVNGIKVPKRDKAIPPATPSPPVPPPVEVVESVSAPAVAAPEPQPQPPAARPSTLQEHVNQARAARTRCQELDGQARQAREQMQEQEDEALHWLDANGYQLPQEME